MHGLSDDQFVRHLTACQLRLFAFIVPLLPNTDAANDVLQETNAELWSKRGEFRPDSNFGVWACRVAHFKVLSYFRDRKRDRLVFDDELLVDIAARTESHTADLERASRWLDECLSELSAARRTTLLDRYRPGMTVNELARVQSRSAGAISKALARTRAIVLACLQRKKREALSP